MLNVKDEGWGRLRVVGSGNLERVRRGRALGEEVASVEYGRTHNLHGNGLIFLSVAVGPHGDRLCWWPVWGGELWGEGGWGGRSLRSETEACVSYFWSLSTPLPTSPLSLFLSLSLPPLNSAIYRPEEPL